MHVVSEDDDPPPRYVTPPPPPYFGPEDDDGEEANSARDGSEPQPLRPRPPLSPPLPLPPPPPLPHPITAASPTESGRPADAVSLLAEAVLARSWRARISPEATRLVGDEEVLLRVRQTWRSPPEEQDTLCGRHQGCLLRSVIRAVGLSPRMRCCDCGCKCGPRVWLQAPQFYVGECH